MHRKPFIVRILAILTASLMIFSAFAVFPAFAAGKTVEVTALYKKIENYSNSASPNTGLRTYFIIGFSSDADVLVNAIKYDTLRFTFTVKDETTGVSRSFVYHSRSFDETYVTDNWWFARIPVCEYGVYPDPAHAYTLSFTAYDGQALAYSGSSAAGAFVSTEEDFLAHGPVIPDLSGISVNPSSPIAGKSILFAGDSITEAICEINIPEKAYTAGWPGRVGVSNGAFYMNLGISGATISNVRGSNQILNQLKRVDGRRFDAIILQGGVNDAWFLAELGQMTPANVVSEGSFDLSTFAGGLEETFRYAKEHFPSAKLGYIVNFTMPNCVEGATSDMSALFALAKQICGKWNVPYLDLYNNEELNVNRMKTSTKFTLGDNYNAHPNDRGYNILFPYVDQFVKAVFAGTDPQTLSDPPFVPQPDYAVTGETNVALGKSAKTSSGSSAPLATDGSTNAYVALGDWADSARGPAYGTDGTCWLEIDLGGVYDLTKINVVNYVGNLLYKWDAYVSTDNSLDISSWTMVGKKNSFEMAYEDGYTILFSPTPARYIRIYGMGHTGKAWVLNEVSAYGFFNESETLNGATLAQVSDVSGSLPDGSATEKLTDGNKTSDPAVTDRLTGGNVTVDLGGVYDLSAVKTYTAERNSSYSLWGSTNGASWSFIGTKALGAAAEYQFDNPGSFRYLKVQWEDSERGDRYVGLAEIEAYAGGDDPLTGLTATAENAVYSGSNAVDGSKTSYTFINPPKAGFILDTGKSVKTRKIVLYPEDPSLPFKVSVSANGSSYTSFASYDGQGSSPVVLYGEANARFFNVLPDGYDATGHFGLYEVEIFREVSPDEPEEVDLSTLPNASLGKSGFLYTTQNRTDTENYSVKPCAGLTDGKFADNWAYGAFGEMYAQIDLGTVYEVSAVNVQTYFNSSYGPLDHAWSVWLSVDGESFAKAATVERTGHPEEGITAFVRTQEARYLRVVPEFYVTSEQFSFREITVYGVVPKVPLAKTEISSVTLPGGGDAGSLFNGVLTDDLAIDGACGGYTTIDLKAVRTVGGISVYTYENNSEYTVFGSADGADWTVIGYKELNTAAYDSTTGYGSAFAVSGSYRYIRVQWAASTRSDGYLTVKEIDVFAPDGETEYADVTVTNVRNVYNNSNADDGNYGNYTFYKKANGTLTVDLGEVKDLRKVEFYASASAFAPFSVERSEDGENYVKFGKVLSLTDGKAALELDYSATRYLRLTGLLGDSFELAEIVAYVPSDRLQGDVDGDGQLSITDVTALLNFLADASNIPAGGEAAADVDLSGENSIGDVTALLNLLAGIPV